jgi:hypothetical protein
MRKTIERIEFIAKNLNVRPKDTISNDYTEGEVNTYSKILLILIQVNIKKLPIFIWKESKLEVFWP